MVTRIPERHRIEYPERGATVVAEELLTVEDLARAGAGKQPPATVTQVAGPTWQQFLFSQLILVVAVALIAGPIAYALVLRARDAQPATTAAPAAAGISNPALAAPVVPRGCRACRCRRSPRRSASARRPRSRSRSRRPRSPR